MKLCVGAVSRRVVEEAARLNVHQIVASRRQVDVGGGYTGLDQYGLVNLVRDLGSRSLVVRDHGGPNQGPEPDDGLDSLRADIAAGFDAVHLDVCKVDRDLQEETLLALVRATEPTPYELGGEHDEQAWTNRLHRYLAGRDCRPPTAVVLDTGAHIWADRQRGPVHMPGDPVMQITADTLHAHGIATKAHNFDWIGGRERYDHVVDIYNLAPELALVEIDAWLTVLDRDAARDLLYMGYLSDAWRRWFGPEEGTYIERARCGVRYVLETDEARKTLATVPDGGEDYVRGAICDAILCG